MTDPARCLWCHDGGQELEAVDCDGERALVHPSHRELLERFCREAAGAKWRFLGGIFGSILLGFLGQVVLVTMSKPIGVVMLAMATATTGITLLKYPFATPETLALVGVDRSIRLVRRMAYVILVMALGLLVYGVISTTGLAPD